MKLRIFLLILVLHGFCLLFVRAFRPISNQANSKRMDRFWTSKYSKGIRPISHALHPIRREPSTTDSDSDNDTEDGDESKSADSSDGKNVHVPQINFYSSVPNAMGVIGQGIIWLREISAALGTPLPLWIFSIPMVLLGIGLMFLPDLTTLGLPLFYPNGAGDGDPLAAFPPLIDLGSLKDLDFITKATQLLPPKLLSMRRG